MSMFSKTKYPFAAIVGQEKAKKAVLIALTNTKAGGLLIGGKKGTGKTTLVRSAKELDPEKSIVELPLNTTEDMLFGSIDIEYAVQKGEKRFSAGILARADQNILYIDEANLLRTELLNAVLDANSNGINTVERDGISFAHPVNTTIIATMNQEEGVLPNQILDRFGMYVEAENQDEIEQRVAIMKSLLEYQKDRLVFREKFKLATKELQEQISLAKQLLQDFVISEAMLQLAAQMCAQAFCAGHRGEFYLLETAKAIAALDKRTYILPKDMDEAAFYVLPHRMRQQPEPPPQEQEQQELPPPPPPQDDSEQEDENNSPPPPQNENESEQENNDNNSNEQQEQNNEQPNDDGLAPEEKVSDIDKRFILPKIQINDQNNKLSRRGSGKRSLTKTSLKQGRYVRSGITNRKITDIAFDATIRAAAPYQKIRGKNACALNIKQADLREKVREKRVGNTFLFVVDASGSMGAQKRMSSVKGAIFHMLQEAYQKRDRVGMIAFRRDKAEVLLPVTRSVSLAQKLLKTMPTGGKTPLADGLKKSLELLYGMTKKDRDQEPILVLVTDGRANYMDETGKEPVKDAFVYAEKIGKTKTMSVVIDTENDFIKLGIARNIAQKMGASYYKLNQLSQEKVLNVIRAINL